MTPGLTRQTACHAEPIVFDGDGTLVAEQAAGLLQQGRLHKPTQRS